MPRLLLLALLAPALTGAAGDAIPGLSPVVYTAAPLWRPAAWQSGGERFPTGAQLMLVDGLTKRRVVPGFFASADAAVSYDGSSILFAARQTEAGRWQIWEVTVAGGAPRRVVTANADCLRPLYLPDKRVAYTRFGADGSAIEVVPLAGGAPTRLTYAPGWLLSCDVLRDGRILFESRGELFTVYPDGTGFESLRCDHGPDRSGARQVSGGDVIFGVGGRLARFTSALALQAPVAQPDGESAGPIAEVSPGVWIVPLRTTPAAAFTLHVWERATGQLRQIETEAGENAVEPAVVAPRERPREFPSGLVPTRADGNLLCLNARESKDPIVGTVRGVRLYTPDGSGRAVLLGATAVETDGSFYVRVPADRPLRMELTDAAGAVLRAEQHWFWLRPSEQRICVGCHAGPERAPENKVPEILNRTIIPVPMLGASSTPRRPVQ